MKEKFTYVIALFIVYFGDASAQNISSEIVEFKLLQQPKEVIDLNNRNYNITLTSPYNLTSEDVINKSKADHQKALNRYDKTVAESEREFQQKLLDYDEEIVKAKETFELESKEFKKLSMLERLTMTEQGKNPQLVMPSKPIYYKPQLPVYTEPDLNDYTIVDNKVLASQINLDGFSRGNGYVDVSLDISAVNFQDNAGQTYANQPTKLVVNINGQEKLNMTFFTEYTFLSSSPSNNINKPLAEKEHLTKVIQFVNDYLNSNYGFSAEEKKVKIRSVKNKGQYDDLARADIYITTNLKKLQPENGEMNAKAFTDMQKGIDIWTQTLEKIDYKNSKADFNSTIAKFIYFNLINLNLALNKKSEAEKYLNQMQDNLIYIKLSSDEENELKQIEKATYELK